MSEEDAQTGGPAEDSGCELGSAGGMSDHCAGGGLRRQVSPRIGACSTALSEELARAVSAGRISAAGVRDLLAQLFVAERCRAGDRVVDVGCGHGTLVGLLRDRCPQLGCYYGIDISVDHISEATFAWVWSETGPAGFPVTFEAGDAAETWPVHGPSGPFDIAVLTAVLGQMPYRQGTQSLRRAADALADDGRIFLSTPTGRRPPTGAARRGEVSRWEHRQVLAALNGAGFDVDSVQVTGLLPGRGRQGVPAEIAARYGEGGAQLYEALAERCPSALLDPVIATTLGEQASEVVYVCAKRRPR